MKKISYLALAGIVAMALAGCQGKKTAPPVITHDSLPEFSGAADSTVYGVCGEGTSMNSLQLITDDGDTLSVFLGDDEQTDKVQGGLLAGDRIAFIGYKDKQTGYVAQKVINVTSLLGKWTSIDKNFELMEGGQVKNNVQAETNPWTSWKLFNGRLLLNKDTFDINKLGPDSLYLENREGIFVYTRQEQKAE